MRRAPLLIVAAFVCAGCGEEQFSTLQDPSVPTTHMLKSHPFKGEGKAIAEWWASFADPQLQALFAQAGANNHDVTLAQEKLREVSFQYGLNEQEAEAQVQGKQTNPKTTSLPGSPEVNDSFANAYLVGDSSPFTFSDSMHNKFNIHFFSGTFGIDLFNAMDQQLTAAKNDILQYSEIVNATATMVRNQLAKHYVNLRLFQNLGQYLQTAGNTLQTHLTQLQERVKAGLNTAADTKEGEDFLQELQLLLTDIENNIQSSLHSITTLTGSSDVDATKQVVGESGPIPAAKENLIAGTPLDTVKNRADLRTKYVQLQHANAKLNVALTDQFPSLTINAGLESSASGIMNLLTGSNLAHALGIELSNNFLNTTKLNTKIRVHKSQLQQAQVEYNKAVVGAVAQVGNSMLGVITARKKDNIIQSTATKMQNSLQDSAALTQQDGKYLVSLISAEKNKILADVNAMYSSAAVTGNMLDLLAALGG